MVKREGCGLWTHIDAPWNPGSHGDKVLMPAACHTGVPGISASLVPGIRASTLANISMSFHNNVSSLALSQSYPRPAT